MASLTELVTSRMTPEVMQKLAGLAGISSPNAKRTADRRPDRAVSRVVAPPRQAPAPARAHFWPWLLALLVLGVFGLWYVTRPAVTSSSLVGTQWRWARTLFRAGSERRPVNAISPFQTTFGHTLQVTITSQASPGLLGDPLSHALQ